MKTRLFQFLITVVFSNVLIAQNLVANNGFEHKNTCVEFKVTCAPEAWFRIPRADTYMLKGDIGSHSGFFHQNIVVENLQHPLTYRSFIYTKILCPLLKDSIYNLSLWLNCPGNAFEHFDVWLPDIEPLLTKKTLKEITAQIIFTTQNVVPNSGKEWFKVSYTYKAIGNEKYLMMGNFSSEVLQSTIQSNRSGDVLYQVDDIELKPLKAFAPCDEIEATRQQLYDMNYRHTSKIYIDNFPLQKMLIKQQPVPVDTMIKETTQIIVDTPATRSLPVLNDTLILPDILFRYNSSLINPGFAGLLDSAAMQIQKASYKHIEIIGHTDNSGSGAYNLKLSLNRAASVKEYFVKKKNFFAENIQIYGKGEDVPIEENTTPKGRERNRRVEIILVR